MKQLKYRRRLDAGLTRVWCGKRRIRVMKELVRAREPLTAFAIAQHAGTSYGLTNDLLGHLDAAGYVTCEKGLAASGGGHPDEWARFFRLNYAGQAYLAAFLAPRV